MANLRRNLLSSAGLVPMLTLARSVAVGKRVHLSHLVSFWPAVPELAVGVDPDPTLKPP